MSVKDLLCPHLMETGQIIQILNEVKYFNMFYIEILFKKKSFFQHHIPLQESMQRDILIQLLYQHVVPKPQRATCKISTQKTNHVPADAVTRARRIDQEDSSHKRQRLNQPVNNQNGPKRMISVEDSQIAVPQKRVKIMWP